MNSAPPLPHASGSHQPMPHLHAQCVVCRRYFVDAGEDCFEFVAPHAAGVSVIVCAACIFCDMVATEAPGTLPHGVALVYQP